MGTNSAPLVTDLFLFCFERDFMLSLSGDKDAEVIAVFNSTSRYLDALLNIDSTYFDDMVTIRTSDKWSNFIWYRGSVSRFTVHLTISDGFV